MDGCRGLWWTYKDFYGNRGSSGTKAHLTSSTTTTRPAGRRQADRWMEDKNRQKYTFPRMLTGMMTE